MTLSLSKTSLVEGKKLRALLEAHVRTKTRGQRDVALLLSSGVDSTTIGMAAHSIGKRVHAYTFSSVDGSDFDVRYAAETARIMDWEHTIVRLPERVTPSHLRRLLQLHCIKKREFECSWPFLFVYPRVQQSHVLIGLSVDPYFGLAREPTLQGLSGPKSTKPAFDQYRRDTLHRLVVQGDSALCSAYNPASSWQHLQLQRVHRLVGVNPYRQKAVYDLFLRFDWRQLNYPRQKHFLVGAYPEYYQYVGHRNHRPYNIVGKLSQPFERLLETRLNFGNRRRTLDMFRDWSKDPRRVRSLLA